MTKDLPTIEELRKMLSYNPDTGVLTWRRRDNMRACWNTRYAGQAAFCTTHSDGYRMGRINRVSIYSHRVAWALAHGSWPAGVIDHINGDRSDNRLTNLRDTNRSENAKNPHPNPQRHGVRGMWWLEGCQKWRVCKVVNGVKKYGGTYHCLGQALAARNKLDRRT